LKASATLAEAICDIEKRLARLMDAYLDESLSKEEYRKAKEKFLSRKHDLEEKREKTRAEAEQRFEPIKEFVLACKYSVFLASSHDATKNLRNFKKLGSNFDLRDRSLWFAPRGAWKLVVGHGVSDEHDTAASSPDAAEPVNLSILVQKCTRQESNLQPAD
jgi:hypothetical protein